LQEEGKADQNMTERIIEPNRQSDRNDLRWAHPGLKDYYYVDGRHTVNKFTNPDKTLEERRAKRDKMYADICAAHEMTEQAFAEFGETKEYMIPGCPEEPDTQVKVEVRFPKKLRKKMPTIFYIAGGAFLLGTPWLGPIEEYSQVFNAVVVAPWYRTGLDARYPGAMNDLHAAYQWMVDNAEELHVNPDKVVITGLSSGAALSLSLGFRLKRYGYKPRGIVAVDPICDERGNYLSHTYVNDALDDEQVQRFMMQYLGPENFGSNALGPEAMCGRATVEDCRGLAPVVIHGAENDVDRDASDEFIHKLYAAGTYAEYHVWGGCCHATLFNSQKDPEENPFRERFEAVVNGNISDFLKYDMRREWLLDPEQGEPRI
jgi:acetyl esterase/lipase